MKKLSKSYADTLLDKVKVNFSDDINFSEYPFCLDIVKNLHDIEFPTKVTFFVGENGAGKSTILEAIAHLAGFGAEGGSKNINFTTSSSTAYSAIQKLADHLVLSWRRKPRDGYFFRAESFFNVATYIEQADVLKSYGCKSLHEQSHGESFMSFFTHRLTGGGFFIFDEPEAALSPQRQLSLLVKIHDLCKNFDSQFIIATHSPLLLAYPGATIYSCDNQTLKKITYEETEHYKITKSFLDNPERFLRYLLNE